MRLTHRQQDASRSLTCMSLSEIFPSSAAVYGDWAINFLLTTLRSPTSKPCPTLNPTLAPLNSPWHLTLVQPTAVSHTAFMSQVEFLRFSELRGKVFIPLCERSSLATDFLRKNWSVVMPRYRPSCTMTRAGMSERLAPRCSLKTLTKLR